MGRPCTICSHKKVQEINAMLATRTTPYREIGKKFHVTKSALNRHRRHLPVSLVKAAERLKAEEVAAVTTGDPDVLSQLKDLGTRAARLLNECELDKDRKHEIAAMREARGLLELQGKLMGAFSPDTAVQVNIDNRSITLTREWPIVISCLSQLAPDVKQRLLDQLREANL